jgi:ferric-dicitrate binding protein FerR (iron transport regulator)
MPRLFVVVFLASVAALLIGARFGFTWAGGDGFESRLDVHIDQVIGNVVADRAGEVRVLTSHERILRGETVRTGDGSRAVVNVKGGVMIALDERSDLTIDRLSSERVSVQLSRGRILAVKRGDAIDRLVVTTNFTETAIVEEAVSVVNYDFLGKVSVIPFHTVASVIVQPMIAMLTEQPSEITETEPRELAQTTFDPSSSNAASFYAWAEGALDYELNQ